MINIFVPHPYDYYKDPLLILKRDGTVEDPYIDITEDIKITNNNATLLELPVEFNHVTISGYTEIYEGSPTSTEFIVDYVNGRVRFNLTEENKTLTFTYKGRGFILYPATRIYSTGTNPDVVTTLQDLINSGFNIQYRGLYDDLETYVYGDVVRYTDDNTYICIAETTGNIPTDINYWDLFIPKGVGTGDMEKSVYDANDNGRVDNADYDNTNSTLISDNTNDAIDELDSKFFFEAIKTHTQTSQTKDLPAGTVDGVATNVYFEGLSLVNSIFNGDLSNGTTGYTAIGGTLSVLNNILTIIGDGTSSTVEADIDIFPSLNDGDVVFVYSAFKVTNSDATNVGIYLNSTEGFITGINSSSPIQNQVYEEYSKFSISGNKTNVYARLRTAYLDASSANGKSTEVDGNIGIFAINMTVLGIDNYTEQQMLDLIKQGYFEGFLSVNNPIIEIKDSLDQIISQTVFTDTNIKSVFGVKDTIQLISGKYEETKRVETIQLLNGNAINTTNIPLAKLNGYYTAYQNNGELITGLIDGTYVLTDDATIYYELNTPQTINLTDDGKVSGSILTIENGYCNNYSNTFFTPLIIFDVQTIESLISIINSKANKQQEDIIYPTLINSFESISVSNKAGYLKDEFGFVHLRGELKTGTGGTSPFTLASGYEPSANIKLPIDSNGSYGYVTIDTDGVLVVYGVSRWSLEGITFKAVE